MAEGARSNPLVRTSDASTTARVSSAFEHALGPIRGRLINRLGADMPLAVSECEFVQLGSLADRFRSEQVRFFARCRFAPSGVPLTIGLDLVLLFRLIGRLLGESVVGPGIAESRPLTSADFRLGTRVIGDFAAGVQHAFAESAQQTLELEKVSDNPVLDLGLPPSAGMYQCTIEVGDPANPLGRAVIVLPASAVPTLLGAPSASAAASESADGMARVLSLPVEAVAELVRVKMPLSKVRNLGVGDEISLGSLREIEVRVRGKTSLYAQPGVVDGVRCIRVVRNVHGAQVEGGSTDTWVSPRGGSHG